MKIQHSIKVYGSVLIGSFIVAVGLRVFLVPHRLSAGGVSTAATVLLHLYGVPLWLTSLLLNAVLFFFGYRFLGRETVWRTAAGILFSSLFLALVARFPVYKEDRLLAALVGGLLMGLGIGLVVRQEASTGGSDFAALMLHRFFPHISVSVFILLIDCVILSAAGLIFRSVTATFYSGLALFVSMRAADKVLTIGHLAKSVLIFSPRAPEISAQIQTRFSRGTTGIYSRGMYTGKNSLMLLAVVAPKELPALVRTVRQLDKHAFLVIADAREVLGEGFQTGKGYDPPPLGAQKKIRQIPP